MTGETTAAAKSLGPPRRKIRLLAGALVVAIVVLVAGVVGFKVLEATPTHTVCSGMTSVGNVSAWFPYAIAAAPYNGSVVGKLQVWANYEIGGSYRNLTTNIPISADDGNVTLGWAAGGNWSVYLARNSTALGLGLSVHCAGPLIANLGPPNSIAAEGWGGGILATGLRVDSELPSSFNASQRCALLGELPDCAVSSTFDLNFSAAAGVVDTCGKAVATTMHIVGQQLAINVPFDWNGTPLSVPTGPSSASGMTGWFNYTFPAAGGIWDYDTLAGVTGGGSGLVFSYSSCE